MLREDHPLPHTRHAVAAGYLAQVFFGPFKRAGLVVGFRTIYRCWGSPVRCSAFIASCETGFREQRDRHLLGARDSDPGVSLFLGFSERR